ncbi:MAG TPA: winged helix-turn-helix domain-containing protein, partial [Thermoanaerobaculia bacterium]|nr:winged helix-turn-helix domain-containing protein [Thermoanaerobaculia bacterium]
GEVVTRDELRQSLWAADTFVDFDTGLNTAISKLREILGDSAENAKFIETLPRRGYRLVAPPKSNAEALSPQRPRSLNRKWIWASALALAILIAVSAERSWRGAKQPAASPPPRIESIAVLPLENLSGESAQDFFADAMTDVLITDLAQIQGLRVISRTSVMPFKNVRRRLPEIARELNVDGIVEGTVTRSGSHVRVTAQLIHASTDQHLWAKSYERDLADILLLQGDLAQAIADAVEVKIAPQVRARFRSAPQLNPDAYDAFYAGLLAVSQMKAEGTAKAIRHFERAVTIQPDFALAYAKLARCHYQYAFFGPLPPRDFMPKAEVAARSALKADPAIAEAHTMLANILYRYHWDWTNAEAEFRRALELSPNDALARQNFAEFLSAIGRSDEEVTQKEIARKLDPKGSTANLDGLSRAPRDSDRVIALLRKNVQRNPTTRAYFQLGSALVMNGQVSEGIKALEASQPERNARYLAYLGYAYGASGNTAKARHILQELVALSRKQYVSSFVIALVHMPLGETDEAIERLEQACEEHAFELSHLNLTPAFDPLRSQTRFRDLVKRVGLPASALPPHV